MVGLSVPVTRGRFRVPPRVMPFLRLGAAFGLTFAGDMVTTKLVAQGATLNPFAVMAVRLLTSLIVLRFPLAGSLIALEADKWDWFWLGMGDRPGAAQAVYQQWDKCLDMVFLGLATIVLLRWHDRRLAALAVFAFAWRAVGVVVLLVTQREDILVAFPNVIETLFLVAVVARVLTGSGTVFDSWPMAVAAFVALLVPKTGEEVFLHAFHGRPWDMWPMPGISNMAQAYLWGIAMYLPPAGVVGWLWLTSRRRAPKTDPEEAMAAV